MKRPQLTALERTALKELLTYERGLGSAVHGRYAGLDLRVALGRNAAVDQEYATALAHLIDQGFIGRITNSADCYGLTEAGSALAKSLERD